MGAAGDATRRRNTVTGSPPPPAAGTLRMSYADLVDDSRPLLPALPAAASRSLTRPRAARSSCHAYRDAAPHAAAMLFAPPSLLRTRLAPPVLMGGGAVTTPVGGPVTSMGSPCSGDAGAGPIVAAVLLLLNRRPPFLLGTAAPTVAASPAGPPLPLRRRGLDASVVALALAPPASGAVGPPGGGTAVGDVPPGAVGAVDDGGRADVDELQPMVFVPAHTARR